MPEDGEVGMSRQEEEGLRHQARLAEKFQHAADRLGPQNLKDIYVAFRFATDPAGHPEDRDMALGIFGELNFRERVFFARMMRFNRHFGHGAVIMAFTRYEMSRELQADQQASSES